MIARKSFLIVSSQFLIRFLGWVGLVVLAKLWGSFAPEALGIIGFAMAFLALFNVISDLGFSSAHIKRVSEGKDLGSCIGTFAFIKILLTSLMIIIIFLSIFIWKNVLRQGFYDATTESVILVFLIYYIFASLQRVASITFEARREVVKQQITAMFEGIVKIPLFILVALAGVTYVGINPAFNWPEALSSIQIFIASHAVGSLAMAYVFGIMATFFIGLFFLRKYPIKRPNFQLFKSYFSFALPILMLSIIGVLTVNIDKIMIGFFWTSTEVGYYFTVQQILNIILIFSTAISTVLFPTLSAYHSKNNFEKIKQTTHLAERYISMTMLPPLVVIIVFVNPVINIMLSNAFLPAAPALIFLAFYIFILSLRTPYFSLISGIDRPDIAAKVGIAICVCNVVLNFLFIPKWGLLSPFGIFGPTGAAIATLLSSAVGFTGLRLAAKKLTGIKLLQSHTPRHIIASLFMAVSLYYIGTFFETIQWYHLAAFSGIGLTIYLSILFLLKEFKKPDLMFFLNMVHPKEMFSYIKSELKEK